MQRHRLLGAITIVAGAFLLLWAAVFVKFFGVPPSSWMALQFIVPGAMAVAAGVLLCVGYKWQYSSGTFAWALVTLEGLFTFGLGLNSYRHNIDAYPWPMGAVEALYAFGGLIMTFILLKHMLSKRPRETHAV